MSMRSVPSTGVGPPQHGVDARQELARRKRLGDVVVGAAFQPRDLVAFFGPRGEHDDRHLAGLAVTLQGARELEAAGIRKHPVDQQQVGKFVGHLRATRARVGRFANFKTGTAQTEGDHFANRALVLYDQNLFG